MNKQLKNLRSESKVLKPAIIIGKNGISDQVITNIKNELKKSKLVKIKILKSYIGDKDKEIIFNEIASKTSSKIVHSIGFTVTLMK